MQIHTIPHTHDTYFVLSDDYYYMFLFFSALCSEFVEKRFIS